MVSGSVASRITLIYIDRPCEFMIAYDFMIFLVSGCTDFIPG